MAELLPNTSEKLWSICQFNHQMLRCKSMRFEKYFNLNIMLYEMLLVDSTWCTFALQINVCTCFCLLCSEENVIRTFHTD